MKEFLIQNQVWMIIFAGLLSLVLLIVSRLKNDKEIVIEFYEPKEILDPPDHIRFSVHQLVSQIWLDDDNKVSLRKEHLPGTVSEDGIRMKLGSVMQRLVFVYWNKDHTVVTFSLQELKYKQETKMKRESEVTSFPEALKVLAQHGDYVKFVAHLYDYEMRNTPQGWFGFYPKVVQKDAAGREQPGWYALAVKPDGTIFDPILVNLH